MAQTECKTFWCRIYMAGDYSIAKQVCRKFCIPNNLCVNIYETDYIFRGGEEIGFCVEIINYPKYPEEEDILLKLSDSLAMTLMEECCQKSYSIMRSDKTYWYSRESDLGR